MNLCGGRRMRERINTICPLCNLIFCPPNLAISILKGIFRLTWAMQLDIDISWAFESVGIGSIIIALRLGNVSAAQACECDRRTTSLATPILFEAGSFLSFLRVRISALSLSLGGAPTKVRSIGTWDTSINSMVLSRKCISLMWTPRNSVPSSASTCKELYTRYACYGRSKARSKAHLTDYSWGSSTSATNSEFWIRTYEFSSTLQNVGPYDKVWTSPLSMTTYCRHMCAVVPPFYRELAIVWGRDWNVTTVVSP